MELIIAEKPSVAQSIAKVLGVNKRCDGYLENDKYLVSWCIGHLVELAVPEIYNESFAKWKYEDLPILPQFADTGWQYQVSSETGKQFGILKKLMERKDVTGLVCATDAGREGELIFRLVYHQAGCRKPFRRLWISSMEDTAIREGFENLKPSSEYDALYEAALCRERADWIVGINATRLFSCLYKQTLNVGRVMTPTLAMVVLRDAEIAAFRPEPFYSVQLHFPEFDAAGDRMRERGEAEKLLKLCLEAGEARLTKLDRKEKNEYAPALYDLTSLQRDANRLLGYTAQQTLDYAQSLYEKKLITYPRTDSRFLTDDMADALPEWTGEIAEKFSIAGFQPDPQAVRRVIDSKKVTDHHAIIPTKSCKNAILEELPAGELQICKMIAGRFLSAVSPVHRYAETICELECGGAVFIAKGKEILQEGWKAVEAHFLPASKQDKQKEANEKGSDSGLTLTERLSETFAFPVLKEGDVLKFENAEIKEGKTSAPKHFSEDTLLSVMQAAGAENVADEVERKGLGTPATRAGIIEKLVRAGLIRRQGDKKTRYLTATDKGSSLITVMPEQIQSPSMTADWEMKLLQMERGDYSSASFMDEITEMITGLVQNYQAVDGADVLMNRKTVIGKCPHCGADVINQQKSWSCSSQTCKFALWKNNAFFSSIGKNLTENTAEKLLRDGKVFLKNCKSKKSDRTYNATVILTTDDDGRAAFRLEFAQKSDDKKKNTAQKTKDKEKRGDD